MKYSYILKNAHFQTLSSIIRVPFQSQEWRKTHPLPFWQQLKSLNEALSTKNIHAFVSQLCGLLATLTNADADLAYTEDDLAWFITQMDGEHASAIASLLLAYASAPQEAG